MSLSIVTPWLDHPELIAQYEAATAGAEVIVVDTGDRPSEALSGMCVARGALHLLDSARPFSFARACNLGFGQARAEVVLFLNNDILAQSGWLAEVERDVLANPEALLGPSTDIRGLAGRPLLFVEGWCIAATRQTWQRLVQPGQTGPWDAERFQHPYWEDVDLCWRATLAGLRLRRRPWPVQHLSNATSRDLPAAYAGSNANRAALDARIAAYDAEQGVARI